MTEQTEVFDPDAHTVAEVRTYLDGATADEAGRVQAAEAEGQDRVGIASWTAEQKPSVGKDGDDGYTREPVEDPYPAGTPAAWGHNATAEGQPGSDSPEPV